MERGKKSLLVGTPGSELILGREKEKGGKNSANILSGMSTNKTEVRHPGKNC